MRSSYPSPRLPLLLVALFVLATASGLARASIGAGVGATPLRIKIDAQPGHRYHFPSLYIVNTGNHTSDYSVKIEQLANKPGREVPASWIHLGRTRLRLRAHRSAFDPVLLVVPKGASSGDYRTDLVVGTTTRKPGGGQGTALGAAAADELSFTIGAGGGGFPWGSPWLVYGLIAAVGLALLTRLFRQSGIRIQVEHR